MVARRDATRTTLMDVARETGLSHMTVQRALMGNPAVRVETRDKVLEAAGRLGYRPNASARAMRNGRFNHVGLLTSTEWERANLHSKLLEGIDEVLAQNDLHLVLARLTDADLSEGEAMPRVIQQSMIDGLLIKYDNHVPQRMTDHLARFQIPHVWINVARPHDCVHPDDFAAAREATERLIALGHQRIAYVDYSYDPSDSEEHYSSRYRYDGYRAAMKAAGLAEIVDRGRETEQEARKRRVTAILDPARAITGIIVYGNESAMWHIHTLAQARGRTVGRDIQMISLDGRLPEYLDLQVPRYEVDQVEVGRQAALALLRKLEKPNKPLAPVLVPFTRIDVGPALAPPR